MEGGWMVCVMCVCMCACACMRARVNTDAGPCNVEIGVVSCTISFFVGSGVFTRARIRTRTHQSEQTVSCAYADQRETMV